MMRKYERVVQRINELSLYLFNCVSHTVSIVLPIHFFPMNAMQLELDRYSPIDASLSPFFGAAMTGLTFYSTSGVRVAGLAGTLGLGAVGATYLGYSLIGKPYGSFGYLFF